MQTLARPSTAEAGQSVQQLPRESSPQVTALSDDWQLGRASEAPNTRCIRLISAGFGQMLVSLPASARDLAAQVLGLCWLWLAIIRKLPALLLKKEAEICAYILLWILGTFKDLQDALLSVSLIRAYALHVLEGQVDEACKDALRLPR